MKAGEYHPLVHLCSGSFMFWFIYVLAAREFRSLSDSFGALLPWPGMHANKAIPENGLAVFRSSYGCRIRQPAFPSSCMCLGSM